MNLLQFAITILIPTISCILLAIADFIKTGIPKEIQDMISKKHANGFSSLEAVCYLLKHFGIFVNHKRAIRRMIALFFSKQPRKQIRFPK